MWVVSQTWAKEPRRRERWREALHPRRSQTAEFSKSCSEHKQRFRPLVGRPFLITWSSLRYKVSFRGDWSISTCSSKPNRLKSGKSGVETCWRRRPGTSGASDAADPSGSARLCDLDAEVTWCESVTVPSCPPTSQILPSPGGSELITITLDNCWAGKTTCGCIDWWTATVQGSFNNYFHFYVSK